MRYFALFFRSMRCEKDYSYRTYNQNNEDEGQDAAPYAAVIHDSLPTKQARKPSSMGAEKYQAAPM
jgi:hypothetical protein